MNPETNRFEELYSNEEMKIKEEIERLKEGPFSIGTGLKETKGQLYRPDSTIVPDHWSVFTIGQEIPINNYVFRVAYIGETSILFEPVGPVFEEIK